jgi:putative ABC transport system permease protein
MHDFSVGIWLGMRNLQHTNPWTTVLIITVILFTFINLITVSGILIGIVDGAANATRKEAVGDVGIKPLKGEEYILKTEQLLRELPHYDAVRAVSPHYSEFATIEANYAGKRDLNEKPDVINATITGIDPEAENEVTQLASLIGEGQYFDPHETKYIILGKYNISRYADKFGDVFQYLDNVYPGDKVRITYDGHTEEFTIKGVIDSKIDMVSLKIFMPVSEFRRFFNRADYNADEILISLHDPSEEKILKNALLANGLGEYAKIEAFTETIPKFVDDVRRTFSILGIFVGVIGMTVASITVFIVIFINALAQRRQIGILKAIGITENAIKLAYVTQACVYALIGSTLGLCITYFGIVPYFLAHPIDFPYGDASIALDTLSVVLRSLTLLGITLIAGYIPAWLIVRQNTVNSILGRK